jgi:tetratricopeptide (TPR) repeat protein
MKCRSARPTPRARILRGILTATLAVAALSPRAGLGAPQSSSLPPDAAARPYREGRDLVARGRYREAVAKLEEAIRTGHETPRERFGTSRYTVDYYDPHYWLGRALMELGDEPAALLHFRASAAAGGFPDRRETQDRAQRIAELERREAARRAPTPTAAAPTAVPTPDPPPPLPTPESRLPEPTPTPAERATSPAPAALPAATPSPVPPPVRLDAALGALAAGELETAAARARDERLRSPGARELDLIEAAALGSRYVLEGRRDASLLTSARESLAAFRRKGGSARAEATLLSPGLRALLEPR